MPWIKVIPIIQFDEIRSLCRKPYSGHTKGCPNFGKKKFCPPGMKHLDDLIDLRKEVFAIYNVFDFKSHIEKMRSKHPNWTKRQLECCLYWQGTARKNLKNEIKKFLSGNKGFFIVQTPEAAGCNLTRTMGEVGILLEWPPVETTYQIVLAGRKKPENGDFSLTFES
jgi:predicted metal-binding protein